MLNECLSVELTGDEVDDGTQHLQVKDNDAGDARQLVVVKREKQLLRFVAAFVGFNHSAVERRPTHPRTESEDENGADDDGILEKEDCLGEVVHDETPIDG